MNKVFYVSMVKNEIDILPFIYEQLLKEEIDGYVIADNMSTDGTREYLTDFSKAANNVTIIDDYEIGYYQSAKMNRLIDKAINLGATHIIAADADEYWYTLDRDQTLGDFIRSSDFDVFTATVWDMVPVKGGYDNPLVDFKFREPHVKAMPSVAFRWREGAYVTMGNHDVMHSANRTYDSIAIRHFQYRSLEQMTFKLRNGRAVYEATTMASDIGFHWRQGGLLSDEALLAKWEALTSQQGLVYDPVPLR